MNPTQSNTKTLAMRFDLNTITHLGAQLYSSLPPVIGELVSNAYDAEAAKVNIHIHRKNREIVVEDDGHGMTFDELNNKFLKIGRNRRNETQSGFSKNNKRKVTGRKGLGKLAIFGIADDIEVTTICDGLRNSFSINYEDIKNTKDGEEYKPHIIEQDEKTPENNGTIVTVRNIRLKTITDANKLATSLSSKFNFFDASFEVRIWDEDKAKDIQVTNEIFIENLNIEREWIFPDDFPNDKFNWLVEKGVKGKVQTSANQLKNQDRGFILYARGKLVQERDFFNDRSNDFFNSYVLGSFEVDFVDESDEDYISTDRKSLFWENDDDLLKLRDDLDRLVKTIQSEWRQFREDNMTKEVVHVLDESFYEELNPQETKMIDNIKSSLVKDFSPQNKPEKIRDLLSIIKNQIKFDSFKDFVAELNDQDITIENMERISRDWESIEIKEMAKLSVGRIETIDKFENFINTNGSETGIIQPFLEKFPWILDPKMTSFEREVTFKKLLKEEFPEDDLEGPNKRLDFLCSNNHGVVHIIELKRPKVKIGIKEIMQANAYGAFLEELYPNLNQIKTYLISNNLNMDAEAKRMARNFERNGDLIIKTYNELLNESKEYFKHFIMLRDEIAELKKPRQ